MKVQKQLKGMDSQEHTSIAMGSQGKTIEEPSLPDKGKGKLDESGKAEETKHVNTTKVMEIQAGPSRVKGSYKDPAVIVGRMQSVLDGIRHFDQATIFRVPLNIRGNKESMFEPSVISIGPYHRNRPHLKAMEMKKWLFLEDFVKHIGEHTLEECVREVDSLYDLARSSYSEPFDMDRLNFTEMMVLDGCFIVEFFYKVHIGRGLKATSEGWSTLIIEKDLILLENQIPFDIILTLDKFLDKSLNLVAIAQLLSGNLTHNIRSMSSQRIVHLLHLCHSYLVPDPYEVIFLDPKPNPATDQDPNEPPPLDPNPNPATDQDTNEPPPLDPKPNPATDQDPNEPPPLDPNPNPATDQDQKHDAPSLPSHFPTLMRRALYHVLNKKDERTLKMTIPCAADLVVAGVKLRKARKSKELTEITFNKRSGSLVIPPLHIENRMKPLLMNLVSLEQCLSLHLERHFSTYIVFMDKLVNTHNDVKILQEKGILDNMLSSEEEVALFFNQSGENVHILEDHYLADLFKRLNRYCRQSYHKHRARFCRDYFSSPWTIFSLLAAIVLLLLTIAQTIMAVLSYKQTWYTYNHPKQP